MLFKSKNKDIQIYFQEKIAGRETRYKAMVNNITDFIEILSREKGKYGSLVIEEVYDDQINIVTEETDRHKHIDERVYELSRVLENYIKEKAPEMDAYVVIVKGELKGVFGEESTAYLKRNTLVSKGNKLEDIQVKQIRINDFTM